MPDRERPKLGNTKGLRLTAPREASNLLESLEQALASDRTYASQDVRGRVTMYLRWSSGAAFFSCSSHGYGHNSVRPVLQSRQFVESFVQGEEDT